MSPEVILLIATLSYLKQLALATAINCFSSRVYGECEFWFAATKALTIIFISEFLLRKIFVEAHYQRSWCKLSD